MLAKRVVAIAGLILLLFIAFSHKGLLTVQPHLPALRVCPEGPPRCDFSTLSEAIRAAQSGMTLFVYSGLYEETLQIDKSLRIVGVQEGSATGGVVLRGTEPGRPTLTIRPQEASNLLLENLTIVGGPPPGQGDPDVGCLRPGEGACAAGLAAEN